MFCNKCGEKLADDAKFCTKCGTKINNEPKMGSIVFRRIGQLYGALAPINVFVDGMQVASIGTNQEVRVPLSIGAHQVSFNYWCGNNNQNIFYLTNQNPNIRITVKLGYGVITSDPKIVNVENI